MKPARVLSRDEVIERLATIIRDEAYPEFAAAPPPEWASRAATKIIDYHQPMLRDEIVAERITDASHRHIEPHDCPREGAWSACDFNRFVRR